MTKADPLLFLPAILLFASCQTQRLFPSKNPDSIKELLAAYLPTHAVAPEDPVLYDGATDTTVQYCVQLTDPYWLSPSADLPDGVKAQASNNNVTIAVYHHRLYAAFRTGPTHFASKKTGVYVISTADGREWRKEMELFPGRDVREPYLVVIDSQLQFYCFTAGDNMMSFEPQNINRYYTNGNGTWHGPEQVLTKGEVHWSMKNRNGHTYLSSYSGSHYELKGDGTVSLFFKQTENGRDFTAVGDTDVVYYGGVSETDFEFDRQGNLWAVTRLEDGDRNGFGSQVAFAPKDNPGQWQFSETDPYCYQSPRMFRHGNELYLIARKQLGKKPFGKASQKRSMRHQRLTNWIGWSITAKTTALYRINRQTHKVEWVMNLPGAGDTAFPSVVRLDEHQFLVANYSSPLRFKKRGWISGQLGKTGIYFQLLTFAPSK